VSIAKTKEERKMKTIKELRQAIENEKAGSAWRRGIKAYALELIEDMEPTREFYGSPADKKDLLNGADSWAQYSEGGCALIYNYDIAERLCSPSELKKTKEGANNPNNNETWIDVQTRALVQAYRMIERLSK
jgi:hypothetical protein